MQAKMTAMSPVIAYTEAAGMPNAAFAEWGARMKGYKVLMPRPAGPRKRGLIGPAGRDYKGFSASFQNSAESACLETNMA